MNVDMTARPKKKERKMSFIILSPSPMLEASHFWLMRQSYHAHLTELSQPPYSNAACLASGRLCLFTQSPGIRTDRERAWPDTPPALPLGRTHRDSNPVPTSTYQLWGEHANHYATTANLCDLAVAFYFCMGFSTHLFARDFFFF